MSRMSGLFIGLIVTVHIAVCIGLMISILLQSGKGGGLAGAFGGGSSQTLFGGRGAAGFLSRATTVLAVVFFVTSLTLGLYSSRAGARRSLVQEEARRRAGSPGQAPAPGTTTPAPGTTVPPGTAPPATTPGGTQAPAPGTPPATGNGQAPATGGP
jgi:preprotein translocase subunit SecG